MKKDRELGLKVQKQLILRGIETPMVDEGFPFNLQDFGQLSNHFKYIIMGFNLNIEDDSIKGTPDRLAKMYISELFYGLDYSNFPYVSTFENKMKYDEMITQDKIQVMSMCEHHFMPIDGYAKISYIPNGKIIGLSKLNRIVNFFSRRPQVQERLTEQIFLALSVILETNDIAIKIKATHYCVKARGCQDQNSEMTTTKLGGVFKKPEVRQEFLEI